MLSLELDKKVFNLSILSFKSLDGSEIGSNCYIVGMDGADFVLDCGLHPKKEGKEALPDLSLLENPPQALLISHSHVDHCGAAPCLVREYQDLECYTTEPNVRLMDRMLHNSVSVMGLLALEQGISGYPLYSHMEVEHLIHRTYGLDFEHRFHLPGDCPVEVSFHPSGHVLGSASILMRFPGHTLYYTGDVCVAQQELMAGLSLPSEPIDTLIIESTRGGQEDGQHISFSREVNRFAKEIAKVLNADGVVLVPSFALGRTQEVLNIIARLMETGRIPKVPVYASGLGRAVYELYSKFSHFLKPDASLRPLNHFKRVGDVWDHLVRRKLLKHPCIIVATSGMMIENTPSAMLAQDIVRNRRNGIFFVGYLDPDTLGYKLLHADVGERLRFETRGRDVPIELHNRQQFHFSAHANREDLCWLISKLQPRNVIFVHGDDDATEWMYANCPCPENKYIPAAGETLLLEA